MIDAVRRRMLLGLGAVVLAPRVMAAMANNASNVPGIELPRPYAVDARRVMEFFTFTCPYCREMSSNFAYWGRTLPGGLQFEAVPVVTGKVDMTGALFFFAVRRMAPEKLDLFMGHAYALIQDAGKPLDNPNTFYEAAQRAGIPRNSLDAKLRSQFVQADTEMALQRVRAYKIEYTPSLALMGQYLVHAGHTNGDYRLLLQLANGLISQYVPR